MEHGLTAVRLGGEGDVTESHVAWRETRNVAEVPSPLLLDGRLYMVANGGLLSCFEAESGKLLFRKRLGAGGAYFASPVAGDGKTYLASNEGKVTVIAPGDSLEILAQNDLGEPILATPAIADGKIYIRTDGALYAFGAR
jgi:outer membrane protein assembly factor BamB